MARGANGEWVPGADIPEGYEPARELAIGDWVFFVFGWPPEYNAYGSGPYEIVNIDGPKPQREIPYLDAGQPERVKWNGQPVISLTMARCPDGDGRYAGEGPFWANDIRREEDGLLRKPYGSVWVKQRHMGVLKQGALF